MTTFVHYTREIQRSDYSNYVRVYCKFNGFNPYYHVTLGDGGQRKQVWLNSRNINNLYFLVVMYSTDCIW
jgi:uncharacterized protein (DUF427 family)